MTDGRGRPTSQVVKPLFVESFEDVEHIYILHDPVKNYTRGVAELEPQFTDVVQDFFPPKAIASFEKNSGKKLKFRNLRKMVAYYNSKVPAKK
jgi:hypothetical protein